MISRIITSRIEVPIELRYDMADLLTFIPNKNVPIHNWFWFKEGFSRELVALIIKEFNLRQECWVLDPFCGSGTTLLTAKELGINSYGIDSSPLATFVTKVKVSDYDVGLIKRYASLLTSLKFKKASVIKVSPLVKKAFSKHNLEDIIFLREQILNIPEDRERMFFMLALMNAAMKSSYAYKDGAVIKIVKKDVPPVKEMFKRIVKKMVSDILSVKYKGAETIVKLGDARHLDFLEDETFDAIITSPPYLNKIEYTKVYEIEYSLFFPSSKVDPMRSYIGLNIKKSYDILPDLDLPPIARAYFYDMFKALKEMYRVLRRLGKLAMVVAGGVFPDRIVESDTILAKIAKEIGFNVDKIVIGNKRVATIKRTIKIGEARESIVYLTKQ